MCIQKLVSLKYPSATLYPPVQTNLELYKRLLRNIPLSSGQDFQSFLDATSPGNMSTLSGGDNGPRNSTQNSFGQGKSFWRKFSFTRKPIQRTDPESGLPAETVAMSNLLASDTLAGYTTAENNPLNPQIPNRTTESEDLNEIRMID
jgi:hypothetical protein